jgi:Rrf2 family protein
LPRQGYAPKNLVKTWHAIRLLIELAANKGCRPMTTDTVARGCGMPMSFMNHLRKPLLRAGILRTLPGPYGGCQLVRSLHDLTLLEIIEAIEGPLTGLSTDLQTTKDSALDRRIVEAVQRANTAERAELAKVQLSQLARG